MKSLAFFSLSLGVFLGFQLGLLVNISKTLETGTEIYCPIQENGDVTSECYREYHVDGNCAYLSNNKIHCGEAYLLKIN